MLFGKNESSTETHANLLVELGPEADALLEKKMAWAKERQVEAEQLALDAARLLSCTGDQLAKLSKQGFFKRCWNAFTGENASIERANTANLLQMQQMSLRYINMLQEQQIMTAHSLLALRNNLLTLSTKQEETQELIISLAEKTLARFEALENRVGQMEITQNLQGWLLTLEDRDYNEKFPTPHLRMMRVINDYFGYKKDDWNFNDVLFLKKALRTVGLNPKQKLSMEEFIDEIVDEIDKEGFEVYSKLLFAHAPAELENPCQFVLDNISSQVVTTLNGIYTQYNEKQEAVEVLSEDLNCSIEEAFKKLIKVSIKKLNVDMSQNISLSDIASELIMGLSLEYRLSHINCEKEIDTLEEQFFQSPVFEEKLDNKIAEKIKIIIKTPRKNYDLSIDWLQTDIDLDEKGYFEKYTEYAYFDNGNWFIINRGNRFIIYDNMQCVSIDEECKMPNNIQSVKKIDDNFVIESGNGIYYSKDGYKWNKIKGSSDDSVQLCLIKYKNKYLLVESSSFEFNYLEKGILWDSTKEAKSSSTRLFVSSNIDGPWTRFCSFANGTIIVSNNIFSVGDDIFAVVGYAENYGYLKGFTRKDEYYHYLPYFISSIRSNDTQWNKSKIKFESSIIPMTISPYFESKPIIGNFVECGGVLLFCYEKKIFMYNKVSKVWVQKEIHGNNSHYWNNTPIINYSNNCNFICTNNNNALVLIDGNEIHDICISNNIESSKIYIGDNSLLMISKKGQVYIGKITINN